MASDGGDDGNVDRPRLFHQRLSAYVRSPGMMIKDLVLFCLAVPGLVALLSPAGFLCAHDGRQDLRRGDADGLAATSLAAAATTSGCNCGDSVAEARAMGCRYHSLAAAWLPAHCIDDELTAEFERSGDGPNGAWRYWLDAVNGAQPISADELPAKGDNASFRFYSTTEWHVVHCIFYWRKQLRSRRTGITVEPRYDSERHANHCGAVFRLDGDPGVIAGVVLKSD